MCNGRCKKVRQLERFLRTMSQIAEANDNSWKAASAQNAVLATSWRDAERALRYKRLSDASREVARWSSVADADARLGRNTRYGIGGPGPLRRKGSRALTARGWLRKWERVESVLRRRYE